MGIFDRTLLKHWISFYSPEAYKRDIFPTKVFGSVEKLPSEKSLRESAIRANHHPNNNNGYSKKEDYLDPDTAGRPRTSSLSGKEFRSLEESKVRPRYNHASSTGTGGAVVGICNENFFKPVPKKTTANISPPVSNVVAQASKVKLRRFRVESSDG